METTDEPCGYKTKNQCYVIKRQNSHTGPLFASDSLNKGPEQLIDHSIVF